MPVSRELVFRDSLIPCAQVLEVLLALLKQNKPTDVALLFSADAVSTLNFAAVYALNPANRDLRQLVLATDAFRREMAAVFATLPGSRERVVIEGFRNQTGPYESTERRSVRKAIEERRDDLRVCLRNIEGTIGYSPEHQNQWLDKHRTETPLTPDSTLSKWRTLVRNANWELAARDMGIARHVPAEELRHNLHFGSRQGRERFDKLWFDTFEPEDLDVREERPASRLPLGLQVTTTPNGRLHVHHEYDSRRALSSAQTKNLRAKDAEVPAKLKERLVVSMFDEDCDYADLPATVERAKAWLAKAKDGQDEIRALYDDFVTDTATKELQAKFEREFTPEQRALLLGKLKPAQAPAAKKTRARGARPSAA